MGVEDNLFTLNDKKGRPIIVLRSNGLVSFYRYPDVSDEDKKIAIEIFASMKEKGVLLDESEGLTQESIMAYLNYETDEDFCG